jgi:hypothetical protein
MNSKIEKKSIDIPVIYIGLEQWEVIPDEEKKDINQRAKQVGVTVVIDLEDLRGVPSTDIYSQFDREDGVIYRWK